MPCFDWNNKQREYTTHTNKNRGWNRIKPSFFLYKNMRQIGKKFTRLGRKPAGVCLPSCRLCISRYSAMNFSGSLRNDYFKPQEDYNGEPRNLRHNTSEFVGASNPALQFPALMVYFACWCLCAVLQ